MKQFQNITVAIGFNLRKALNWGMRGDGQSIRREFNPYPNYFAPTSYCEVTQIYKNKHVIDYTDLTTHTRVFPTGGMGESPSH